MYPAFDIPEEDATVKLSPSATLDSTGRVPTPLSRSYVTVCVIGELSCQIAYKVESAVTA